MAGDVEAVRQDKAYCSDDDIKGVENKMHTDQDKRILYIIMPAYNEEESIADAIEEWYPIIERNDVATASRLVIVNDGSSDKTEEIVRSIAETKERLVLLNKEHNGHGSTVLAGYGYALQHGADYVFQTDSDRQTDSKEFDGFWAGREEYEAILGKRTQRGDGIVRLFIEKVLCVILWLIYDVRVPDANAPFRLFSKSFLEKYLYILPANYFFPNVILAVIAASTDKVKFIEITFKNRRGKSSINLRRIGKIGIEGVISFWAIRKTLFEATCGQKHIELRRLAVITVVISLAFLMAMQSTVNIWHIGEPLTDSSVFRYVAKEMQRGSVPYRDTFDHKGPLIYLINLMGMNMSYWTGVWVIEFLMLIITFAAVYRIGRLYCGRIHSCLTVFCVGGCLFKYFEGGNLVEEYALPFIVVSIYIFLDYFVNEKTNIFRVVLCGFSFAAVCFLRINMAALWPVMCIGVIFKCLRSKEELRRNFFSFLTGFLVLAIPIMLWLIINGALDDFIDCYIKYNMLYSSQQRGDGRWQYSFMLFLKETMVLLTTGITLYLAVKIHAFFDILYTIYIFTTLFFLSMSGNTYMHYGMILIPMMAYPVARFFGGTSEGSYAVKDVNIRFGVLYLTCVVAAPVWLAGVNDVLSQSTEKEKKDFSDDLCYVSELVKGNSTEEDKITVWGNWDAVYLLSDRMSCSRYSYPGACFVEQSMIEEYFKELEESPPKVIVGGNYDSLPEQLNSFLVHYGYVVAGTNEEGIWNVYVRENK